MCILYHRMLKYYTNIYQLDNMKSLLFQSFLILESKNISESIMPTTRSFLDSKNTMSKTKNHFLHITGTSRISKYVQNAQWLRLTIELKASYLFPAHLFSSVVITNCLIPVKHNADKIHSLRYQQLFSIEAGNKLTRHH